MLVASGYVLAALLLYCLLWTDLGHAYLRNGYDQNLFEWFFAVAAKSPRDVLFSTLQNSPAGVNMMANTSVLGLGIPLAPVTWLFGPSFTWALVLTGGVAGSAFAWYWLISRHITTSRTGAVIGGAFCAFAPPMISHGWSHPNFVSLFVLPLIIAQLIRIRHGGSGIVLGFLLAYQVFLGEEPLLIAGTALLVYGLVRREVLTRAMFRGLGVAALVALPLAAYPLWMQFFGPQSYSHMEHGPARNDLAAFVVPDEFAPNPTEVNAYLGWPLVILVVVLGIWLWRVAAARALTITAAVMAVLSLGWELTVAGVHTGIPLPWLVVSKLPLYDSVIGSRLSMACVPVIGILLAMGSERILTLAAHATHVPLRLLWFGALTAALLPIVPIPKDVVTRPDTPAFFTHWQNYVTAGKTVVTVPLASSENSLPLHWQVDGGLKFPLAEGYFVGPGRSGHGQYGAVRTPTSQLLENVAKTGEIPAIGPAERDQAERDLRFWNAGAVVLGPHEHQDVLLAACEALFGPGHYVEGVWLWTM